MHFTARKGSVRLRCQASASRVSRSISRAHRSSGGTIGPIDRDDCLVGVHVCDKAHKRPFLLPKRRVLGGRRAAIEKLSMHCPGRSLIRVPIVSSVLWRDIINLTNPGINHGRRRRRRRRRRVLSSSSERNWVVSVRSLATTETPQPGLLCKFSARVSGHRRVIPLRPSKREDRPSLIAGPLVLSRPQIMERAAHIAEAAQERDATRRDAARCRATCAVQRPAGKRISR